MRRLGGFETFLKTFLQDLTVLIALPPLIISFGLFVLLYGMFVAFLP